MPTTYVLSPNAIAMAKQILVVGVAIFGVVEGLKNTPWFADVFNEHPALAIWVNAILSLLTSLGVCLAIGVTDTVGLAKCVLTAIGTFLAAAGIHRTALRITNPSASSTVPSPATDGALRK